MVRLLASVVLPILTLVSNLDLEPPTYSGMLPPGFRGTAVLDTTRLTYVLSDSGDRVVVYTCQSGTFQRRFSLPKLDLALSRHDSVQPCGFSLRGDVDRDGIDEFVIATNRTLKKYKMLGGTVALTSVASIKLAEDPGPLWITDGCIGDIDNDGTNEVLISATSEQPPACGGDSWSQVILFVCRWNKDSLVQLTNDGGVLQLEQPSFDLPAEIMRTVADPRNTGTNRLIFLEGRGDDVHPAVFREVVWRDGRLVDEGILLLQHGRLQRDDSDWDAYNSATGCRFGQVRGKTTIIADIFDLAEGREELFVFSGDSVSQHLVLWPGAWTARFANLDGKGAGILHILNLNADRSWFEFYRL